MEKLLTLSANPQDTNEQWRELDFFADYSDISEKYPSNKLLSSRFTIWNVVPKTIYDQFQKKSNLWFLAIICLSYGNFQDTLWNELSQLVPFILIISINLLKNILNCYQQVLKDKKLNFTKYLVWNGNDFVQKLAMEIVVSDILLLLDKESAPADVLLLYVGAQSDCYADTSLILGERNLQAKKPIKDIQSVLFGNDLNEVANNLNRLNGVVFVKKPSKNQEFVGKIKLAFNPKASKIDSDNLLLRSSIVTNTPWVIAFVTYTGCDTNHWIKKKKTSLPVSDNFLENGSSYMILMIFLLVFINTIIGKLGYNSNDTSELVFSVLKMTQNLVPISMFLAIYIVRIIRVFIIKKTFRINVKDPGCIEDMGQVEYIVADKTGTLTKNELVVQVCIIGDSAYWNLSDDNSDLRESPRALNKFEAETLTFRDLASEIEKGSKAAYHYLICMALCNHTFPKLMGEEYLSLSIDDKIIVQTASSLGMKLLTRTNESCTLNFKNQELEFLVLGYHHYMTERKKCRILVRNVKLQHGYLYVKGSKEEMLDILHLSYDEKTSIEEFTLSKNLIRMRTVLMGYKKLGSGELEEFDYSYQTAISSPLNTEGRVDAVFEALEKNCEYLGIVALEDLISNETRDCLSVLSQAGIKTWITSGDTEESTLTAGVSSKLFEENVRIIRLTNFSSGSECRSVMIQQIKEHILHENGLKKDSSNSFIYENEPEEKFYSFKMQSEPLFLIQGSAYNTEGKNFLDKLTVNSSKDLNSIVNKDMEIQKLAYNPSSVYFVLSIDKTGLEYGTSNDELRKLFVSLLFAAHCVCFHSLKFEHKTKVVRLLKKNFKFSPVVLGIGDGVCDAGMLQEAQIGVGVIREDSQISNTAKLSLDYFYQLKNIILIQGHWSFINLSTILYFSLYSKVILTTILLIFNGASQFSGSVLLDDELIVIYFVIFPVVQIVFVGLYDQDVPESKLNLYPEVYSIGIYKQVLTVYRILSTAIEGIIHGFIVSIFFYIGSHYYIGPNGRTLSIDEVSLCICITLFLVSTMRLLLATHSLHFKTLSGHFIAFIGLLVHLSIEENTPGPWYEFNSIFWNSPALPVLLLTTPAIIFTASYGLQSAQSLFWPTVLEYIKKINSENLKFDLISRLETFKDELTNVFKRTTEWQHKKDTNSLEFSKKTLKFFSDLQETEYTQGKIIENIRVYRVLIMLGIVLTTALVVAVMSIKSLNTPRIIVLPCLNIILLAFIPLSFTEKFKQFFGKFVAVYYALILIIITIAHYLHDFNLIETYSALLVIFFIEFSINWFEIAVVSFLSVLLNCICAYFYYLSSQDCAALALLYTTYFICLCLNSAAVGYSIDKTKRQEFILIRKVEIEVNKSKSVLSYLLPAFVRKRVKDGVRYIADDQGTVSIIFCDIMDFEEIVASFTPPELTAFLDDVFGKLDQIYSVVGVTKIETVGKTYMACAGLKDSDAEIDPYFSTIPHARRAIEMGLAIIRTVKNIKLRKGVTLSVKIGINSGTVTAGVIGSHKPQFSLVGDTVNTASRMASTCPSANTLQISNSTYELLEDKSGFVFEPKSSQIKGKGVMQTWLVRLSVSLLEKKLLESSKFQISLKGSSSPKALGPRSISLYQRNSDHNGNYERRLSALLSHLEISDTKQLFQRKDTELIEQVQWFSFKCNESDKEKKFRMETVENKKPIVAYGMILIILCNCISVVIYSCIESRRYYYIVKLAIETCCEIMLFIGLNKNLKELWYAWNITCVYVLSIVSDTLIGILQPRDAILFQPLQFLMFVNHVLLFSHCSELFFKHNLWILILTTAFWLLQLELQQNIFATILTLIITFDFIFTIFNSEKNLRINSTLKAAANKELDKTEKLIKQMMPPHVVQNLKDQSSITDRVTDVTILYADIVGFTNWSSTRSPEEIVNMLSELFTMFDNSCVKHDVYKVHTIGDCYVAMGYTGQDTRDVLTECNNILEFALEMLETIQKVTIENEIDLNMRIGIHTGDIIAGVTGTSIVRYDIYGSDVMIANKTESCGSPGQILVSEATKIFIQRLRPNDFIFNLHTEFFVKTTKKKISTFFLEINK